MTQSCKYNRYRHLLDVLSKKFIIFKKCVENLRYFADNFKWNGTQGNSDIQN